MKFKKILAAGMIIMMLSSASITSFAAQWQQNDIGWWYQEDDGSWPANGWKWINGKCYYFKENGYILTNTTTPDGYIVNADGAWVIDGVVQMQNINTDYPLQGLLAELHLELDNVYTFKDSKYNNSVSTWTAYNESLQKQIFEPFSFYVARLAGEMHDFDPAGIYKEEMDATYLIIKEFLNSFDWRNASDRTKVEKAAQLVCQARYTSSDFRSRYTPYGCLVQKEAVCDGFAYSFAYLTRLMGMESFHDPFSAHAVNAVKIDGKWYVFDGTMASADTGNSYYVLAPANVTVENGVAQVHSFNFHDSASFTIKIR